MKIRRFEVTDYPSFADAMASDLEHTSLDPRQFLVEPKTECKVLEDEDGPVLYFRLSRELRIDIQFRSDVSKERIQKALPAGLQWLEDQEGVRENYRALTFDSEYRPLKAFAKRRLKFKESPDLRKAI